MRLEPPAGSTHTCRLAQSLTDCTSGPAFVAAVICGAPSGKGSRGATAGCVVNTESYTSHAPQVRLCRYIPTPPGPTPNCKHSTGRRHTLAGARLDM